LNLVAGKGGVRRYIRDENLIKLGDPRKGSPHEAIKSGRSDIEKLQFFFSSVFSLSLSLSFSLFLSTIASYDVPGQVNILVKRPRIAVRVVVLAVKQLVKTR
jgi:hypothetical protein